MYKCLCGKEIEKWNVLCSHFSRTCIKKFESSYDGWYRLFKSLYGEHVDFIIEEYRKENLCCAELDSWAVKLITLIGLKRSHSQEKQTDRYKNKFRSTLLSRYGVINPSQCDFVKQKVIDTIIEKHGSYENWKTSQVRLMLSSLQNIKENDQERWDEICEKRKCGVRDKWGVDNVSQVPEIAQKMAESNKKRLSILSVEERQKITEKARFAIKRDLESSIEIKVQNVLNRLGISFEKHLNIGNRNYDIVIQPNIIIECQGDYWHANPKIYNETDVIYNGYTAKDVWERDEYKRILAIKHGFIVITLWESDINSKSEENLINFVKQEIENVCSTSK